MSNEASFKLRSDLAIETVEDNGKLFYVVKDPRSGRYFRIKPLEHFLITRFNGKRSLEDIRRDASEQRKVLVSEDVLLRFAHKFRDAGLLEDSDDDARRVSGSSIFSMKFPLARPDDFIEWLYPKVKACCSTPFAIVIAATLFLALFVVFESRHELTFGFAHVLNLHGILLVLVTLTLVTVLHELAHAVVCRHFGGRVSDMGFLLLYFFPCFYVNVSDAYFFKQKRQRLWVFFAGAYFELFIWGVSVLLWRVCVPRTWLSEVLFIIIAVCAVRSFFNLNPLIRMDGYFLLSDIVGIANLRRVSFEALGRLGRRILSLDVAPPAVELRERRIFSLRGDIFVVGFGIAAMVYTLALVFYVVLQSGSWVFESYGADAFSMFAVVLTGLLHKPALSAAETAKEVGKEKWTQLGGVKRRLKFFLLWGVPALLVAFCPWPLRITSELEVFPQGREIVRAPTNGRIAQIHFREGDSVAAGALLLDYDTDELVLKRKTKAAALAQAEAELRLLGKEGPTIPEEIEVAERSLDTARSQERTASQNLERHRQLWSSELIAKEIFDGSQNAFREAVARRAEAEARLALVRKESPGSRLEQMEVIHLKDQAAQQAAIAKLQAELAQIDDVLARSKTYASISGTLTTYRFEETLGTFLEEGAEIAEIVDDRRVVLEMPVEEKDIDVIELGQEIKFKVRGYPSRRFRATVDAIAPVARDQGSASSILLRAGVDNEDRILKPGMTGVAKIYAGTSFVAHIWTRDIIRFIRTEFWL